LQQSVRSQSTKQPLRSCGRLDLWLITSYKSWVDVMFSSLCYLSGYLIAVALTAATVVSCASDSAHHSERQVVLQPTEDGRSVLKDVVVTLRIDGDSIVVPYDVESGGYPVPETSLLWLERFPAAVTGFLVPEAEFREVRSHFTVRYNDYTFTMTTMVRRAKAIRDGRNDVRQPLRIYMIRPAEAVSIPLGDESVIVGRSVPNSVYIGHFSDTSELAGIISDLEHTCDVVVERSCMMDPNNAILLLDRGLSKSDSPILRHLRTRMPALSVGLVAIPPEMVPPSFRFGFGPIDGSRRSSWQTSLYRYTNKLTIEFKEHREENMRILREFGLEFQDNDGQLTHAVADPGMGESILSIAQKLEERPEVRSVSVNAFINPRIR